MAVEQAVELKQIDLRLGRLEQEVRELQETLWRPDRATSVEHVRVGDTVEDILEHLPYLTKEQVHAALDYYRQHKLEIDSRSS